MYVAPQSREDRQDVLLGAIADIHFGALVITTTTDLEACHIPMLVRETEEGTVLLEGHVSRANPIWRLADHTRALAMFQGPHAYVHPGWYPSKKRDGRAVPTWAYIAVHAHGRLTSVEDEEWLTRHLRDLIGRNEAGRAEPWEVEDAPPEFVAARRKGIVGLSLEIDRLVGNWKMAQKQPLENRLGAAAGLTASPRQGDREVGAILFAAAAVSP